MIYPRFIGRLGNNLFQIAACIGYAKKYGTKWGIRKGYIERGFHVKQIDTYMPWLPRCDAHYRSYTEFQERWAGKEFNFHPIPFHPNGVEIVGFWQSEKYFENAREEVLKAINLTYFTGYESYCSIHVRRGDYVNNSGSFPPVTIDYIERAMKHFPEDQRYLVFSDEIPWCKENLKGNLEFSEGRNEWVDLCLMASCGHNIIANSSYSWWGAWLNKHPNRKVISPSHKRGNWFGMDAGVKHDCIDLIPDGWIQIEFR